MPIRSWKNWAGEKTAMPDIILTETFLTGFRRLSSAEQKQARKAIRFLGENPHHPSLQVHIIKGTNFWEAYVNKDIRMIYLSESGLYTLMAIGHHDILKNY